MNKSKKIKDFFERKYIRIPIVSIVFLGLCVLMAFGGNVIIQDGKLNVTDSLTVDDTTFHVDNVNNRVGIGTTSPDNLLHILGSNAASAENITGLKLDRSYSDVGDQMNLDFGDAGANGAARIAVIAWGGGESAITFSAQTGAGTGLENEVMRIRGDGNVGIGTTSPATQLVVRDPATTGQTDVLTIRQGATNGGNRGPVFAFEGGTGADQTWTLGRIKAISPGVGYSSDMIFEVHANPTQDQTTFEAMRIQGNTGNVGIGEDSPPANTKLAISGGDVKASDGVFYSDYQYIGSPGCAGGVGWTNVPSDPPNGIYLVVLSHQGHYMGHSQTGLFGTRSGSESWFVSLDQQGLYHLRASGGTLQYSCDAGAPDDLRLTMLKISDTGISS